MGIVSERVKGGARQQLSREGGRNGYRVKEEKKTLPSLANQPI